MTAQEFVQEDTENAGFDFGRGSTALDRHVAWLVTDHHGYDYAKSIGTEYAWATAYDSYKSFRNVAGTSIMCKPRSLPEWLFEAVQEHARRDSDTPGPSCFAATSTAIDWFALAKEHSEELFLVVDFDPAPTVQQIEKALRAAQERSAEVDLWVTCEPSAYSGGGFAVSLGGLFITPRAGDTDLVSIIERELGGVPAFIDPRQPKTLEWAWMTQWPEAPATSENAPHE